MTNIFSFILSLTLLVLVAGPVPVLAAEGDGCLSGDFKHLVTCVSSNILNPLAALLIGVALLVFLWGVVKYVASGADATKRKEGGALMAYGIFGLFVMVSVWGLVNFVSVSFFGSSGPAGAPPVPQINLGGE
ncbi:MAG: hypothetical protein WDZ73_00950 [Candidatus Paceibacterota bacterium]